MSNIAFLGLDLDPNGFTGVEGVSCIRLNGMASNIYIEDCKLRQSYNSLNLPIATLTVPRSGIILRRNVLLDCKGAPAHFFDAYKSDNVFLEENIFDNQECLTSSAGPHSTAIHTYYNTTGVHLRRNVFTNLAGRVCVLSGGGLVEDSVACSVGGGFKVGNSYDNTNFDYGVPGGVRGSLIGNLLLERKNVIPISGAETQALACFEMENIREGYPGPPNYLKNNIATQSTVTQTGNLWKMYGILLMGENRTNTLIRCCVEHVVISGNKLVDHMATDGGKQYSFGIIGQPIPGGGVADIDILENDFQESVATLGALCDLPYQTTATEVLSSLNRFNRAGGANRYMYFPSGSLQPIAGYRTFMGDQTSISSAATYVDPTRTMNSYAVSLGYADKAAMIAAMRDQNRNNWDVRLGAAAMLNYFRAGFL